VIPKSLNQDDLVGDVHTFSKINPAYFLWSTLIIEEESKIKLEGNLGSQEPFFRFSSQLVVGE
jgi:hypothetical protein